MVSTGKLRTALLVSFLLLNACGGSKDREGEYFSRAQTYFSQGNYDKTRVELKNVLQINPKNIDARYLMALLAEQDQDWRKMYGLLLGIVEEKPEFIEAQNKLGKLFLFSGQIDKALDSSELILSKDANNVDALVLKAAVLMRKGELPASEAVIRTILAANPGHVDATLMLAKQYGDNKKFAEALELLDSALLLKPDDLNLALFKINYLVALKSFPEAETVFLPLIAANPDNASLHYNLASFYIAWGDLDKAEQVLRDYIALKPDETQAKLALVEFLLQQKGVGEAEKSLRTFISENPQHYEFHFALAQLYKESPEQAIAILNEIVAADRDGVAALKANNLLAMFAVKQGDKEKARSLLDEIIKNDPGNSDALMLRSRLLVDEGHFDAAIADLRTVMRDTPDSEKAFMLSANAHLKSGFFDLAEDSLEKVLLINPKNTDVRKNLARLMVRNKDEKGAIKLLEAASAGKTNNADVLSMLVDLYIRTGEWDKAIELASSMPDPENTGIASYKLAQIYFAQKKYRLASAEYAKVLALKPLNINVLAQLSQSYLAMGEPDKAETLLNKLIAEHPKNASILNLKGMFYNTVKRSDKALLTFAEVIKLDSGFAPGYRNLGTLYATKQDFNKAIEVFKSGLAALPNNISLLVGLASVYEMNGNLNAAIDTYTLVLNIEQDNKIAANNLAALIANTSDDTERLHYALGLVKVFRNYKVPALLDTYGWLSYLNGEYEEALLALEKVVAMVPDFPEFEYHLGMVYAASGRVEEAKIILEKSVSSGAEFVGVDIAKAKLLELKERGSSL